MHFYEIYEKSLVDTQNKFIPYPFMSPKPIMIKGIISPESTINTSLLFGTELKLDKKGMREILEMFENMWTTKTEKERKNLLSVLTDVDTVTREYLGKERDHKKRENLYSYATDMCLKLSEIKGENIGFCAEEASIGHQLITILETADLINFESFFTNSYLTTDTSAEPHSFIVLNHKKDSSKQFIFDITNPLKFKPDEMLEPIPGLALYSMTEEEYSAFKEGKSIAPKSVYEQFGKSIVSDKRFYGQEKINIEDHSDNSNINDEYITK